MYDLTVELGLGCWVHNPSHRFNGVDHGIERRYWIRRRLESPVGGFGGILDFHHITYQGLLEKGDDCVGIERGDQRRSIFMTLIP